MIVHAVNLKPGMRVRPMGPRGGWQWATVRAVKNQGFLVNVHVEWVAGGAHTWLVPREERFRISENA